MMVTDASVWVSALHRNDVNRPPTRLWLANYLTYGGEVIAPTLLLAEVSGAIARRTGKSDLGHLVIAELLAYSFLRLLPIDYRLARLAAEMAADYRSRGADAIYAAVARAHQVPLLTWDQEQMARVRAVVRAGPPGTDFDAAAPPPA